ncbi:MAG: hypothetical protein KKD39_09230 [Candidatus Altiarchaeota archaeon]|nr:hypothetical protein [Candidatus Altiarchaeota archaeon]
MCAKRIVQLGNVGDDAAGCTNAVETIRAARSNPGIEIIGISLREFQPPEGLFRQIRAEFIKGLDHIEDGSADVVESDMSLGFYDSRGHRLTDQSQYPKTKEYMQMVFKKAFKKLKPGGEFRMSCTKPFNDLEFLTPALTSAGFKSENIQVREFEENEYDKTRWTKLARRQMYLYQVTATK